MDFGRGGAVRAGIASSKGLRTIIAVIAAVFGGSIAIGCESHCRGGGARCGVCQPCDAVTTTDPILPAPYMVNRASLDAYVAGTYHIQVAVSAGEPTVDFDLVIAAASEPRTFTYLRRNSDATTCPENAPVPDCEGISLPYAVTVANATASVTVQQNLIAPAPMFINGTGAEGAGHYPSMTVLVNRRIGLNVVPVQYVLEIRSDGTVVAWEGNQQTSPPDAGSAYIVVGARIP